MLHFEDLLIQTEGNCAHWFVDIAAPLYKLLLPQVVSDVPELSASLLLYISVLCN